MTGSQRPGLVWHSYLCKNYLVLDVDFTILAPPHQNFVVGGRDCDLRFHWLNGSGSFIVSYLQMALHESSGSLFLMHHESQCLSVKVTAKSATRPPLLPLKHGQFNFGDEADVPEISLGTLADDRTVDVAAESEWPRVRATYSRSNV